MQILLETRWKERDIELGQMFLHVVGRMNKRGALHSTVMVQAMFKVACEEFVGSRRTIVSTVIDSLAAGVIELNKDELLGFAVNSLEERCKSIDGQFRQRARVSGMLDSGMLKGQIDLATKIHGAINELKVELVRALDEYDNKNNINLKDKILHRLLSIPAVAWLVIVVVVVAALVSLISDIVSLFNGS